MGCGFDKQINEDGDTLADLLVELLREISKKLEEIGAELVLIRKSITGE